MANHESEARSWLDHLRRGTDQFDLALAYFRKEMEDGKLTLADLGTSETELRQLRKEGARAAAMMLLNCLRIKSDGAFVNALWHEVQKGNLSFSDIGSSRGEFADLVEKAVFA